MIAKLQTNFHYRLKDYNYVYFYLFTFIITSFIQFQESPLMDDLIGVEDTITRVSFHKALWKYTIVIDFILINFYKLIIKQILLEKFCNKKYIFFLVSLFMYALLIFLSMSLNYKCFIDLLFIIRTWLIFLILTFCNYSATFLCFHFENIKRLQIRKWLMIQRLVQRWEDIISEAQLLMQFLQGIWIIFSQTFSLPTTVIINLFPLTFHSLIMIDYCL